MFQKKSVGAENYYVMYTLCFLVFFLAVFAQFLLNGKSLVWGSDGITQGYPGIVYTRRWIREFLHNFFTTGKLQGRMWDMTIGEGFNVLNVLSFRPLTLFSLLFSEESLEWFFWFRIAVSLYISGIAFLCFCRLFKRLDYACLIGALLYTFNGMTIGWFYRQSLFIECIIYLPIILYGTEKILRRESGKAFVISVALAGLSYFYILYMITVFAVMYAAVRYWFMVEDKRFSHFFGEIGRFALYYALGFGIAAVSFLPNLVMAFSSNRIEANGNGLSLFYNADYYTSLITAILDVHSVGAQGFIGLSVIALLMIVVLFAKGKKTSRRITQFRIMVIVGAIVMLFPIFSRLMSGGSNNRWFFGAAFGSSLIVAMQFDEEWCKGDFTEKKRFWIGTALYLLIYFWIGTQNKEKFGCISFLFFYLAVYFCWKDSARTLINKKVCYGFIAGLLLLETGYKAYNYYQPGGESMSQLFVEQGAVYAENNHVAAKAMDRVRDEDIYRIDSVELSNDAYYQNKNYGQRIGMNGISSFYSYTGKEFVNTMNELGVSRESTGFDFSSYDQRTILDELSAVKYVTVTDDMRSGVPYGYNLLSDENNVSIYQNKYFLPLIYAYSSVTDRDAYDKLSANLKEQAMLQSAVVEGDAADTGLQMHALEFDAENILNKDEILNQMKAQSEDCVSTEENSIMCDTLNGFELQLPHAVTGEVYVLIEGFRFEGKRDLAWMNASLESKGIWKRGYVSSKSDAYYRAKKDVLLNLGYTENDSSKIKINFVSGGTYFFDNIQIIVQPMEHYAERVENLRIPVENLSIDDNHVTADIILEEPRMVCVAIPYGKGWCAKINGKETELKIVNGKYMGIKLKEGDYHLELMYVIPGFNAGAIISAGTILVLIVYALLNRYRKVKKS